MVVGGIRTRTRGLLEIATQNLDNRLLKGAGGLLVATGVVDQVVGMRPLSLSLLVIALGLGTWGILQAQFRLRLVPLQFAHFGVHPRSGSSPLGPSRGCACSPCPD